MDKSKKVAENTEIVNDPVSMSKIRDPLTGAMMFVPPDGTPQFDKFKDYMDWAQKQPPRKAH